MPPAARDTNHEKALSRRVAEIRQQALSDQNFMQQVHDGVAALARGERGKPLRDLTEPASPLAGCGWKRPPSG